MGRTVYLFFVFCLCVFVAQMQLSHWVLLQQESNPFPLIGHYRINPPDNTYKILLCSWTYFLLVFQGKKLYIPQNILCVVEFYENDNLYGHVDT